MRRYTNGCDLMRARLWAGRYKHRGWSPERVRAELSRESYRLAMRDLESILSILVDGWVDRDRTDLVIAHDIDIDGEARWYQMHPSRCSYADDGKGYVPLDDERALWEAPLRLHR